MGAIYILDNLTDHGFLRKLSYLKSTVEFRNGTFFPEPNSYLRLLKKRPLVILTKIIPGNLYLKMCIFKKIPLLKFIKGDLFVFRRRLTILYFVKSCQIRLKSYIMFSTMPDILLKTYL